MGLDEEQLEKSARTQIQRMVDHPAFRNDIRVMPDTHRGAGSVIGFTMPLGDRITPNVVGVDIGCGVLAGRLGDRIDELDLDHLTIDERVRNRIPMGWGRDGMTAPNRDYYHVKDEFPWQTVTQRLDEFTDKVDASYIEQLETFLDEGGYTIDYFKELVTERAGQQGQFDLTTAIEQVGTLGSGNHFIEICESEQTGDDWIVIHSGSRGLGANTSEYWQYEAIKRHDDRAERARTQLQRFPAEYLEFDLDTVTDKELLDWLQGGKGEDFVNYEAIPREERETVRKELKAAIPDNDLPNPDEALDYLEDDAAAGYLIDMLFCQEYAAENRREIAVNAADALGTDIVETIHARHNIVDFRDGIIRKGATRAYEGERVVIPFNMSAGTLVVEGGSNESWNNSVCHGAGRVMSRREAEEKVSEEELRQQMEEAGAYASELPLDEAPAAYKDISLIEEAIQPTADIVDRLSVVHNFKSPAS